VRAVAKKEIMKNVYLDASVGGDTGSKYKAGVAVVGLKINF
jgi:hypothetical protein